MLHRRRRLALPAYISQKIRELSIFHLPLPAAFMSFVREWFSIGNIFSAAKSGP
jgi:hypothetical protein